MSTTLLKVDGHQLEFLDQPKGAQGSARVRVDGKEVTVAWRRDSQGLWMELDGRLIGLDIRAERTEDSGIVYEAFVRGSVDAFGKLKALRPGDEQTAAASKGLKKAAKIKSQMPGKIVKVLVAVGDEVQSGQPLIVIEAMKMENEIKSHHRAKVTAVKVQHGQAVETGAELVIMEPIA